MSYSLARSLNAFINVENVRINAARKHLPMGSLAGALIAVKDNIDVAGLPTSAGTPVLAKKNQQRSAPVVDRLVGDGVVVAGKTNMHELAFGITSKNEAFGYVRNPLDHDRSAGGSSGGSAAAVAAGLVSAALGTDTAGSVRVPAAFCGCIGFRPSSGRYPTDGVVPLVRTRDTVGPIARCVGDIQLMDASLSGSTERVRSKPKMPARLGVATDFRSKELDTHIENQFNMTKYVLRANGIRLVDIDSPGLYGLIARLATPLTAYEIRRDLFADIRDRLPELELDEFLDSIASPDVAESLRNIVNNKKAPDRKLYERIISVELPMVRDQIHASLDQAGVDAIVFPTTPTVAFPLSCTDKLSFAGKTHSLVMATIRNMQTATLAGLPSITMPMCTPAGQLPGGLTVEGRANADRELLDTAFALEYLLCDTPSC